MLFFLFSVSLAINVTFVDHNNQDSSVYSTYEYYSNKFSTDSVITKISDSCDSSVNKVKDVFDKIPMDYDHDRENTSFPLFRTPSDYFIFGGVCRDYTLLRHSALSNLGINCLFDFSHVNHVFLICYYEGLIYKLDNGRYIDNGY